MADKKYVMMKWKDGWREVIAVEGDVIDFNKYYVIERLEQYGRLVLNRPKGTVPELIVIDRDPTGIEKVALLDSDDQRTLAAKDTYREGTRLEYNYNLPEGGDLAGEIAAKLKEVLAAKGMSAKDLLLKGDADIIAVARAANIVGTKSQQDLVHFLKLLLRKI
jgi:hypothetical protein